MDTPDKKLSSQAEETVEIEYTDGHRETLTMRPMPVARFGKAFDALSRPDWLELIALYANRSRAWADTLEPGSVSKLMAATMQGNGDFFVYAEAMRLTKSGELFRSRSTSPTSQPPPA